MQELLIDEGKGGRCAGVVLANGEQLRAKRRVENARFGGCTARRHGLFGGRPLLSGCSAHAVGAMEPRSLLSAAEGLPRAGPTNRALVTLRPAGIVGDGCVLTPLTLVQKQGVLPAAMVWAGNPAEKLVNLPARGWEPRDPVGGKTKSE